MSSIGTSIDIGAADYVAGLAKGLAVLECFDTERQRISASVAADRAGITRTSARRQLLTLASLGYLETDGRYFWLTPKVLRFSGSYLASARLPRVIQPTLNRLAVETGEALSAVVLEGSEVVLIGRSGPTRLLAYGLHLGARLPAHATSTGQMLLACLTRNGLDEWLKDRELKRFTPHTLVEAADLRRALDRARRDEFCVAHQEHELGVCAIAVPVRDLHGTTVAALNVVMPSKAPLHAARVHELVGCLRDGARELRGVL